MAVILLSTSRGASKWLLLLIAVACFHWGYSEDLNVTESSNITSAILLEGSPMQENAGAMLLESPSEEVADKISELSESTASVPEVLISIDEEPEHVTKNETILPAETDILAINITESNGSLVPEGAIENNDMQNNSTEMTQEEPEHVIKNETVLPAEIEILSNNATESNSILVPAGVIESNDTQNTSTEVTQNEIEQVLMHTVIYPPENETHYDNVEHKDEDEHLPQTEVAKKKTNIGILALLLAMLVVALTIFVVIGCIHWFRKQESLARTAALEKDVVIIAHKKSAWSASSTIPTPTATRNNSMVTTCSATNDGLSAIRVDAEGKLTV